MSEERATYTAGATMPPALDLDAIERRANAATAGRWVIVEPIDKRHGCGVMAGDALAVAVRESPHSPTPKAAYQSQKGLPR